jgi:hypothetical protein
VPGKELDGFRIVVNTRGERGHKPHVHVIKDRTKCKIMLDTRLTPYDIVKMRQPDFQKAREIIGEHFGFFVALWEKYHG